MSLRVKAVAAARAWLLGRGFRLARGVDAAVLARFFGRIRPLATSHGLVRVGDGRDGGYVLPDDLAGIAACFSPGVSSVADFELEMARRGVPCFLADYSVEAPPVSHKLFHFEKKFLGVDEDGVYTTLDNWVARHAPRKGDLLLQMDIEGAEYAVLAHAGRETLRRFRVIAVEFHDLDALADKLGSELINLTFARLLEDFEIVHMHPNNCYPPARYRGYEIPPLLEVTFLRKDRVKGARPATQFPHPLDRTNVPERPDFALPACWYRRGG